MSTQKTIKETIDEINNWLRLATFLNGLLNQLLYVLHNKNNHAHYQGLPEDPADLFRALSTTHKKTLDKLKKGNILKKDQYELLLPTNGNKADSQAFDVTLIVVLIINCTTLPAPVNGWKKNPLDSDNSVAANVLRTRAWRDFLSHADSIAIDQVAFNHKWNEGIDMLQGLRGSVTDMATLKICSLDPGHETVIRSLMDFNQWKIETLQKRVNTLEDTTTQVDKNTDDLSNLNDSLDQQQVRNDALLDGQNRLKAAIEEAIAKHNKMLHQLQYLSKELKQMKKLAPENERGFLLYDTTCSTILKVSLDLLPQN